MVLCCHLDMRQPVEFEAKALPRHGAYLSVPCSTHPLTTCLQLTVMIFTVLHPAAVVASTLWGLLRSRQRRTGPIALPPDEEGAPNRERPAREVDAEAIWG